MINGLGTQVDGNHYTNMKMQPIELAYKLYATPCFCKLAKYLTRNKGDKLINLQKALHCVKLEQDLRHYARSYFDMLDYNTTTETRRMINEFTDNEKYQEALFSMWMGDYDTATSSVEQCIQELEQ